MKFLKLKLNSVRILISHNTYGYQVQKEMKKSIPFGTQSIWGVHLFWKSRPYYFSLPRRSN